MHCRWKGMLLSSFTLPVFILSMLIPHCPCKKRTLIITLIVPFLTSLSYPYLSTSIPFCVLKRTCMNPPKSLANTAPYPAQKVIHHFHGKQHHCPFPFPCPLFYRTQVNFYSIVKQQNPIHLHSNETYLNQMHLNP